MTDTGILPRYPTHHSALPSNAKPVIYVMIICNYSAKKLKK
jgi:hypothetical protein